MAGGRCATTRDDARHARARLLHCVIAVTGAPSMQIGVITNPNSRKNKGRPDRARRLQSIVGNLGEVHETRSLESIKPVLRDFLRKRARYWVADGGDGALHWMFRMGMEVMQEDEFREQGVTMPR